MVFVRDYLGMEYGSASGETVDIRSSVHRSTKNIFGASFPCICGAVDGAPAISLREDLVRLAEAGLSIQGIEEQLNARKERAKILRVKRFIIDRLDSDGDPLSRVLNAQEASSLFPRFDHEVVETYCSEGRFIGIELEGVIAGAGIYTRVEGEFEEIAIKVSPAHRKKGIGTAIVRDMARGTLERDKLFIYVCEEGNIPSRKIIEEIGGAYSQDEEIIIAT